MSAFAWWEWLIFVVLVYGALSIVYKRGRTAPREEIAKKRKAEQKKRRLEHKRLYWANMPVEQKKRILEKQRQHRANVSPKGKKRTPEQERRRREAHARGVELSLLNKAPEGKRARIAELEKMSKKRIIQRQRERYVEIAKTRKKQMGETEHDGLLYAEIAKIRKKQITAVKPRRHREALARGHELKKLQKLEKPSEEDLARIVKLKKAVAKRTLMLQRARRAEKKANVHEMGEGRDLEKSAGNLKDRNRRLRLELVENEEKENKDRRLIDELKESCKKLKSGEVSYQTAIQDVTEERDFARARIDQLERSKHTDRLDREKPAKEGS